MPLKLPFASPKEKKISENFRVIDVLWKENTPG